MKADRQAPIGVFDSGVGGLTVVREIMRNLPDERIVYFGDTARVPYGSKSKNTVIRYSRQIVHFLETQQVKAIVIACNTATSVAASTLRQQYPSIPIIGIEPALKPAVLWKEHDKVAVMATPATLALPKFHELMKHYSKESDIYPVPCPGLADYVEKGIFDGEEITEFLKGLLAPSLEKHVDAIVLGCTHYPFVEKVIQRIAGPDVKIFNGAHGTALELQRRLRIAELLTPSIEKGTVEFYSSSTNPETIKLCHQLFEA